MNLDGDFFVVRVTGSHRENAGNGTMFTWAMILCMCGILLFLLALTAASFKTFLTAGVIFVISVILFLVEERITVRGSLVRSLEGLGYNKVQIRGGVYTASDEKGRHVQFYLIRDKRKEREYIGRFLEST